MYIMIPILVLVIIISFILERKNQDRIVSELSPFSFADDMLIINTQTSFAVQGSNIDFIDLQYNPKRCKNRFYDMKIRIVKTDGSRKNIRYRGSGSGAQPNDMVTALTEHNIKCSVKD